MALTGRPKALLELSSQEREQLERWARRRKSSQALALRSRIVLRCAEGLANIPDGMLDAVVESAEECPGECIFIEAE